jgi:site-specific DNA-cytosine methylase
VNIYTFYAPRGGIGRSTALIHKSCGNSIAVPVLKWIGQRIAEYEDGKINRL